MAPAAELDGDAYLDAFMSGFGFVLLAIKGRLAEAGVPAADRQRLDAFLRDYERLADAYRNRRGTRADRLRLMGALDLAALDLPVN